MSELRLAVIGKDVSRSSSPEMHTFIAERMGNKVSYASVSIAQDMFEDRIEALFKEYDGFNVTIPFKLSIMPHLKKIEGDALVFGAVNTVVSGTRTGYNTDGLGFMLMLKNNGLDVAGRKVLLLGAGGAGRSVAKKLSDAGAFVSVYDVHYDSAKKIEEDFIGVKAVQSVPKGGYDIVINATGVGMHASTGMSPVDESAFGASAAAIDLIYVPAKSRFLEIAESLGKKIINGQAMLFYQAYYSECIYFGASPDAAQAKEMFAEYTKREK